MYEGRVNNKVILWKGILIIEIVSFYVLKIKIKYKINKGFEYMMMERLKGSIIEGFCY